MNEQERRRTIDVALVNMEKQFGKGTVLYDLSFIHQANAVAQFKGFLHIMGNHNNGFSFQFVKCFKFPVDL